MKRLLLLGCWLALTACGHPPIEAKSLQNPVLFGPVRHLRALSSSTSDAADGADPTERFALKTSGAESPGKDGSAELPSPGQNDPAQSPPAVRDPALRDGAVRDLAQSSILPGGTRPFSFTSIVATTSYATGLNTASGSTSRSAPGSFGAAVEFATAGYPDARLEIETITCVARFSFPVFYANSTERCTVDGNLTLGEPSPDAGGRRVPGRPAW
jgi:hypothetical protein